MPTPQPVKGGVRSLYGGGGKENGTSVAYQPTQGLVLDVRSYEVWCVCVCVCSDAV